MLNIISKKLKTHEFLGGLGFFPFIILIILFLFNESNINFFLNIAIFYLFIIISFIGASYWGIAINLKKKDNKLVVFSIFPSILVSLIYIITILQILKLLIGIFFLNLIFIYEKNYLKSYLPNWYLRLRKNLNLLVSLSVFIIIFIVLSYKI